MASGAREPAQLMPEVVVTATIKPTEIVPNPLHKYASYTYNVSLWWLDFIDYNNLMQAADPIDAMNWTPGPMSYCVAEDAGQYSDKRVPGTVGLNYNIQDVKIETYIGLNKLSRTSNLLEGSMTIVEPYGVTWFDTLLTASYDGSKYNNWTKQPFMLQIDFKGFDDSGNPIPETEMLRHRKRFPITILTAKVNLTNKGSEYALTFAPMSAIGHYPDYSNTPQVAWAITAKTVGEFFDNLTKKFVQYYKGLVDTNNATFIELITFTLDPEFKNSPIVSDKELPLSRASVKSKDINLKETTWNIPPGTPILDIITKVMAHSKYLIDDQLELESGGDKNDYDIFKAMKTTASVRYAGYTGDGTNFVSGVIDPITNRPPKIINFKIGKYYIFDTQHPQLPQLADSALYTVKKYDYYYTGQNTDVINFKLDFDTTFYTATQVYTSAISATELSQSTKYDESQLGTPNPYAKPNIAWSINTIPNFTPISTKPIVRDKETSSNFNLSSRPAAQIAADVLKSIYKDLNGDMLRVDMDIVGDPTLIKQDDWLYVPEPGQSAYYLNITNAEYAAKYGHIKMDDMQVVVTVNVNSPVDIDTEYINQGLMTPPVTYSKSIFSGQYQILRIVSKFSGGKFEQSLELARYFNDTIIRALNPSAVSTSQQNQKNTSATNNSGSSARQ